MKKYLVPLLGFILFAISPVVTQANVQTGTIDTSGSSASELSEPIVKIALTPKLEDIQFGRECDFEIEIKNSGSSPAWIRSVEIVGEGATTSTSSIVSGPGFKGDFASSTEANVASELELVPGADDPARGDDKSPHTEVRFTLGDTLFHELRKVAGGTTIRFQTKVRPLSARFKLRVHVDMIEPSLVLARRTCRLDEAGNDRQQADDKHQDLNRKRLIRLRITYSALGATNSANALPDLVNLVGKEFADEIEECGAQKKLQETLPEFVCQDDVESSGVWQMKDTASFRAIDVPQLSFLDSLKRVSLVEKDVNLDKLAFFRDESGDEFWFVEKSGRTHCLAQSSTEDDQFLGDATYMFKRIADEDHVILATRHIFGNEQLARDAFATVLPLAEYGKPLEDKTSGSYSIQFRVDRTNALTFLRKMRENGWKVDGSIVVEDEER